MSDVKVGQLWFGLGFDVDQVKLNDVVESIGKLNLNSVLAGVGVAGLVDGLKQIMDTGSALTEEMYKFQTETGLSGQKMKQWDEYAQRMGASAGFVEGTLKQLNMLYGQFLTGSADPGIKTSFMAINQVLHQMKMPVLNESDLKNPFTMLQKITVAMQEIKKNNPSLAQNILSWTHIGDQLLLIKSFDAANSIPVPTDAQTKQIRDYNASWTAVGQTFQLVITDLASDLAPGLKDLGDRLNEMMLSLHKNGPELGIIFNSLLAGISLLLGPWAIFGNTVYLVLTHLKEINALMDKIRDFGKTSIQLRSKSEWGKNDVEHSAVMNGFRAIENTGASVVRQITNNNTFHIVAHGIEDFEHKTVAVVEKLISNSFRQSNFNH